VANVPARKGEMFIALCANLISVHRGATSPIEALAEDLRARVDLDLSAFFIDGTFVVAKNVRSEWKGQAGQKDEAPAAQDGLRLRRYRRRYKVERLFVQLQNFRLGRILILLGRYL
jgi:hypothetical protein